MSGKKTKSVDLKYLADEKLATGKERTLDKVSGFKGPNHKERLEQQKENRREVQKKLVRSQEKVSWKKKAGGVAAVLFLCGVGLFQFVQAVLAFVRGSGVVHVEARDTAKLKTVLFSGEPWLVYCVNNSTRSQPLPKVLEQSAWSLSSSLGLQSAVLPCWDPTESGRSVAQRFKLRRDPPLSFVVANGNSPRLLNLVGISKTEELEKRVKPALILETHKIDALRKWGSLCTSRRTCVVVGYKHSAQREAALNVLRPLLEQYRAAKVVTLDTSFWQLKLDDRVVASRRGQGQGKRAEVLCLAREDASASSGSNATHSGAFLQDLDRWSASAFLKACVQREGLVPMESTPRIKARPAKKVVPTAMPPSPRPTPPASKPREPTSSKVDRVGSREKMESEEPLFEAVEEDEGEQGEEEERDGGNDGGEDEDEGEEVEL